MFVSLAGFLREAVLIARHDKVRRRSYFKGRAPMFLKCETLPGVHIQRARGRALKKRTFFRARSVPVTGK